jgi:molybdopterin biosynthesis enzyme
VELVEAVGQVTAAAITAPEVVPGFLRASMDGCAVAARDTFGASAGAPQYLEVKGEVAMGAAFQSPVQPGEVRRAPTGAMLHLIVAETKSNGLPSHTSSPSPEKIRSEKAN